MLTIEAKEADMSAIEMALQEASLAQNFDKIQTLSIEYETVQQELETLMEEWETKASE